MARELLGRAKMEWMLSSDLHGNLGWNLNSLTKLLVLCETQSSPTAQPCQRLPGHLTGHSRDTPDSLAGHFIKRWLTRLQLPGSRQVGESTAHVRGRDQRSHPGGPHDAGRKSIPPPAHCPVLGGADKRLLMTKDSDSQSRHLVKTPCLGWTVTTINTVFTTSWSSSGSKKQALGIYPSWYSKTSLSLHSLSPSTASFRFRTGFLLKAQKCMLLLSARKTDRPAAILLKITSFHPFHPVRSKGLSDLPYWFSAML